MKTAHKGKAVRSWMALGLKVETKVSALHSRMAGQYMWALRRAVGLGSNQPKPPRQKKRKDVLTPSASGKRQRRVCSAASGKNLPSASGEISGGLVVEVVWDSTHFATKDIQVNVVY